MRHLAILAILALTGCGDERPQLGWRAGPIISGQNYSPDCKVGGQVITIPAAPGHCNYITRPTGSLAGKARIVLRYRIEADGPIVPRSAPALPSMLSLYVQRAGDDWSGRGKYEAFRWYSPRLHMPITAGEHELSVGLDENWTAVQTSSRESNPQAFREALAKAGRIGFVLGGGSGRGHGVYGPARIIVLNFSVE
jgi:hypothetical protein